jgi:hypothetical protein
MARASTGSAFRTDGVLAKPSVVCSWGVFSRAFAKWLQFWDHRD